MQPEFLALSIIILLFSVIVHEVMHGVVALKFGDNTAQRAGRLTLNPIPHIDIFGTLLLPALLIFTGSPILFGWAKPVPVNPLNFYNLRKGELFVSSAGVLANFGLAIIGAILYHLVITFFPNLSVAIPNRFHYIPTGYDVINISDIFHNLVVINLLLAVFNLLPIPPLDGSKVLLSQLPYNLAKSYSKIEPYGFIILLILFMFPIGGTNIINLVLGTIIGLLSSLLGI